MIKMEGGTDFDLQVLEAPAGGDVVGAAGGEKSQTVLKDGTAAPSGSETGLGQTEEPTKEAEKVRTF